jgi:glycosyltransferase involved in cell wall biosynthesis
MNHLGSNSSRVSISLILPVFNEERVIEKSIERLLAYLSEKGWDFELIFVEDGCTDNTISIVDRYALDESRIKIIKIPHRLGKGGSIKFAALNCTLKDYVAYMDSDLAADPSELEKLITHIKDHDVVLGSRILRGNLPPIQRPAYRTVFSHLYSKLFRVLFRIPLYDPQCGLKLFKNETISKLLDNVTVLGFAFDTDLIVEAYSQDLKVKEVPINWAHGKFSTVRVLDEIREMGLDVLSIWYSSHLLWKQNKKVYPQKKGSIGGQILFTILSLSNEIKKRPAKYPEIKSPLSTVNKS